MSRASLGWPNTISIARTLLIAPFAACLLNLDATGSSRLRYVALGLFVAMAASDWLDGFLARRLHAASPLGQFLDPLGDKLLILASVLILSIVGVPDNGSPNEPAHAALRLPNWVVVAAIAKDVIVLVGFILAYLVTGRIFIHVIAPGKWCTAVQMLLVLSMLLWPDLPPFARSAPALLGWAATALAVATALGYVGLGLRFFADADRKEQS